MTTIALRITSETVDLITVLNGGIRPSDDTFGNYFVCDLEDAETTGNHKIVSYDVYRNMRAREQATIEVRTFTN